MDTIGETREQGKPRYVWIHKQRIRDVPFGPLVLHMVKEAWAHKPKGGWHTLLGVTRQAVYAWSQYVMPVIPDDGLDFRHRFHLSVLLDPEVRQAGKAAFLALELFEAHGSCFPKIETLAKAVGRHRRYIQKGLAELSDKGYLTIERRPNTSNLYRLHYRPIQKREQKDTPTVNKRTPLMEPIGPQKCKQTDTPTVNERTPLMTTNGHPKCKQTDTPRWRPSPVLLWRQGKFQEAILSLNPNPNSKPNWEGTALPGPRSESGTRGEGEGDRNPPLKSSSPSAVTPVTDLEKEASGYAFDDERPVLLPSLEDHDHASRADANAVRAESDRALMEILAGVGGALIATRVRLLNNPMTRLTEIQTLERRILEMENMYHHVLLSQRPLVVATITRFRTRISVLYDRRLGPGPRPVLSDR